MSAPPHDRMSYPPSIAHAAQPPLLHAITSALTHDRMSYPPSIAHAAQPPLLHAITSALTHDRMSYPRPPPSLHRATRRAPLSARHSAAHRAARPRPPSHEYQSRSPLSALAARSLRYSRDASPSRRIGAAADRPRNSCPECRSISSTRRLRVPGKGEYLSQ